MGHLEKDIASLEADTDTSGLRSVTELPHAASGEVNLILRQIEVAKADARGEGRNQDWVCTLEAREWLRHTLHPYMLDVAPLAAPTAKVYREWLDALEVEWCALDQQPGTDPLVMEIELGDGPVPQAAVEQYQQTIIFKIHQTRHELDRYTLELAEQAGNLTNGADLAALDALVTKLETTLKRLRWLDDVMDACLDRLKRLSDLLTSRGVTPSEEVTS